MPVRDAPTLRASPSGDAPDAPVVPAASVREPAREPERKSARPGRGSARPGRGPGWLGGVAVVAALASALATFLILVGATPLAPTHNVVVTVFLINGLLVVGLVAVIAAEIRELVRARRVGAPAARLHGRIVGLFSLVASLPTILLALVASVTLERGLSPWFADRMRDVVLKSVDVADAYLGNQCQSLAREVRILSDDLTRARPAFDVERPWFEGFLTARATSLGLPVAQILRAPAGGQGAGEVVARASIDVVAKPVAPDAATFEDAARGADPICMLPSEGRIFGALVKLPAYGDAYLLVEREVSQLAVEFPGVSRLAAAEYLSIEARRQGVQVAFASMFALIALIVLLSAIWFGLNFANRFVAPIRRLINAADQVASGNFYAQVPVRRPEGDLAHLGATFNKMTSELRRQHDDLRDASDVIDRRRRFTEAVLSGVSAGVIGVDAAGIVTIANPSSEAVLGLARGEMIGTPLGASAPELAALLAEARASHPTGRGRLVQGQVQIGRGGRERTVNVRVTGEGEGADRGTVVTLDDITDLVSAQRTSAWADVARRIAHEIKNPLTPIQLSAERIRRKYGRVITADKDVFEQCTDTIVRQVEDIKRMVDEFSSFARMPKPAIERNDLAETVRQALFMMRVAHPEIAFGYEGPAGPAPARFDPRLIAQAFTNLLKNAVEAVAAVPEEARGPGRIDVMLSEGPDAVVVEITDNGKGFPAEGRQKLLEPYMTTREGGTGLGLAIVSKVLEEHGGGIELNDNPDGRGGRVRIWIAGGDAPAAAGRGARGAGSAMAAALGAARAVEARAETRAGSGGERTAAEAAS